MHPEIRRRRLAWLLVAAQLILITVLVLVPAPRTWPTPTWLAVLGVILVLMGGVIAAIAARALGPGFTASPLPSQQARLATTGVYRYVRHPIYAALLLAGVGVVLVAGQLARAGVWLALLALLWLKAGWEERELRQRFTEYADYAARTGRLLPRLRRG
jgi:protein-S-isoprenylcysteine O-methyltransferase Ste14